MKSVVLQGGNIACPECKKRGRDSTDEHLMVFSNGNKYCYKCGYKDLSKSKDTTFRQQTGTSTMAEFKEVATLPELALEERGISEEVAKHFGIKSGFNVKTGKVDSYYYPFTVDNVIVAYKKRSLPKTFSAVGASIKGKPLQFIGQDKATQGKKLLITEGQDDMLAAYQMLYASYNKFKPSVVSLPNGANLQAFKDNEEFLNKWEEVIFCPDNDDAGKALVEKIASIRPDIKFMKISEKDANDMLKAKKGKDFVSAYFRAAPFAPEGFVTVEDVYEEATSMPTWGKDWPWPSLTKLTYGRRLGEGMYIGAGVKVGKSDAAKQIAHHIIVNEGNPVAMFCFEEKPAMTTRKIAGKIKHKQFHKPDGDFTQDELKEGVNAVKDKLIMYDSYGSTEWDKVKLAIRHAVVVDGCEDIIIDPLTRLTAGMDSSDANVELERIADELSSMAKDLGFFFYVFCHLKAPQSGKPHEEGGTVHSNQFTGSRAMMRCCYYMIGLQRNKMAEDETERNTTTFVLLEDRAFGMTGRFDVFYNTDTGTYLEPEREFT